MRALAFLLGLLCTVPSWAVTSVTAGTDLSTTLNSAGTYELQAGTHNVTAGFTMAADVTLTAVDGATLVIKSGQILKFADRDVIQGVNIAMENNSRLQAEAVVGDTEVIGARIQGNTFGTSGTITTAPMLRFGQGFNSYHRRNLVVDNDFYSVYALEEVGEANHFIGNRFYSMDGLRPIQIWGSYHRVVGNYVGGGIFGISLLGKANIAADRRPCTGNVIDGNIVVGTSEEGISMDTVGNVAAESLIREYDTIKTLGGSSVVTLNSANWVAQTTYTGSKYDLTIISATNASMVGKRYKITTHSGAAFTLDISGSDYANLTVGDGVSIALQCYDNAITNNTVIPVLTSSRAYTSGIVLHGIGVNNTIQNNLLFGENDGVGTGDVGAYTHFALRETSLNGITATDSVTGLARRGLVGLNSILYNTVLGGDYGADYNDYGSNTVYTPPASTYTGNATSTKSAVGWTGGADASEANDFCLEADSPLIAAGSYIGAWAIGYAGHDLGKPPAIGARGLCRSRQPAGVRPSASRTVH